MRRAVPGTITRMVRSGWPSSRPKRARSPARRPSCAAHRRARALAGLDEAIRRRAPTPRSADADLLERDGLRFTHPMMREAALRRRRAPPSAPRLHRRAAALLRRPASSEDEIAAH